ncbi:uncharacterized protein K452DRAFT_288055 [Aplosporella prunicola CBS 121167]|uniref:Uncharacterized protein n=1 Tax=Aplosporella prunicola CBS 121167 TaxID=1176127 RepID=A0A6A6BBD1_9PEZI|nr:uncharacterized protein K452DRAFT_288055 [Aplosporella prunicola CBS 121167]KAF2141356.1 hypothetical protein K452DRAFT_288055 [Aplosporella prunicola CBS 121167]
MSNAYQAHRINQKTSTPRESTSEGIAVKIKETMKTNSAYWLSWSLRRQGKTQLC